jgi:hypothetical protein
LGFSNKFSSINYTLAKQQSTGGAASICAASIGRRHCYHQPTVLLPAAGGLDATCILRCSQRMAAVLQTATIDDDESAAMGGGDAVD